jgi:hypothetical protein
MDVISGDTACFEMPPQVSHKVSYPIVCFRETETGIFCQASRFRVLLCYPDKQVSFGCHCHTQGLTLCASSIGRSYTGCTEASLLGKANQVSLCLDRETRQTFEHGVPFDAFLSHKHLNMASFSMFSFLTKTPYSYAHTYCLIFARITTFT